MDIDRAIDQLRLALPVLDGKQAHLFSEAHRRHVVEIGDIVFRIPHSAEIRATQRRSARLLSLLALDLPLRVPRPIMCVLPSAALPYGAMGYEALPGHSLDTVQDEVDVRMIAHDVGLFLRALHRVKVRDVDLPGPSERRLEIERTCRVVLPVLRDRLTIEEFAVVDRWWQDLLADEAFWRFDPVLLQGDLWDGNILVDGGRAVGIVDFEYAAVGDPGHDLGTLLRMGETFAENALNAYREAGGRLDQDIERRMRLHFELRAFSLLRHALDGGIAQDIDVAVAKLREGPVLHGPPPGDNKVLIVA